MENIDKSKIITNVITAVIIIFLSTIIIVSFSTIVKPMLEDKTTKVESEYLDRIEEAMVKIYDSHIDDIDMETLIKGAISGIARSTEDPYTRYLSQEEYDKMLVSGTEKYGGLGIHITYDREEKGIRILSVMPGSPALEEGLEAGDVIRQVNDIIVNFDNYYECVDNIKGEEGTKVTLIIQRGEEIFTGDYTRKIITVNNIETKVIDDIGYIKILSFDNQIANQFTSEYVKLLNQNISGLIIDLRNNPGGLLHETIGIARMLLPKGEIVRLVYKDREDKIYTSDGKNAIKIPLVVLVNGNSASASEILAGAVKDLQAGTIVGEKTFGKGVVQSVEKLEFQGALAITTSQYYTSSGNEINNNGITPNVEISLNEEYRNKNYVPQEKDLQLQKAVEIIKNN